MWNMYQGIQNVIVKLSTKESQSESYLLINSHFDSKPGSPGSGDDGVMVVVMLEVLRQMATSETPFQHGIIFLFNGAEENALQGAHGFITQHKWAPNCRALINLESGGSGGRDLLFQSGPNTPWLMKYYRQHAKHPFATTLAEETWQAGIIPSDTDFRIFRDFGNVPGLDIAQANNGYVYHTAFDTFKVIPGGSIQNTGNNILALARAYANASELSETEKTDDSHAVFFDFLGLFFVYYTESTGIVLNTVIGVLSLVLVGCSLWRMSCQSEKVSIGQVLIQFLIILGLHVVGLLLSICLPLLMAVLFDAGDRSLTYFTSNWLVFGLYVCPAIIGLVLPLTLYLTLLPNAQFINVFRWPKLILLGLGVVTFIFCMIAVSEVGFPYRPKTNVMRVHFMQTKRIFYDYDGTVTHSDSGYYFIYQDRRGLSPLKDFNVNLTGLTSMEPDCDKYLLEKSVLPDGKTTRFEFELTGPPQMNVFIQPVGVAKVTDWSFDRKLLEDTYQPPYVAYISYGIDESPLKFFVQLMVRFPFSK
ncbi:GM21369 [Drosophila sechellia]|uniref:FXNA-like protease n=1 Tax=Drosophila sechellia TaxID=7238 RepID=B4HP98_DROSE|nr:GM21369 [Drosophila sechellia]